MSETDRPLRADARRNREKILTSAGELFARQGREAQMDEIAQHCGLGLGTLYRHFPTKEALLTAIVTRRFEQLTEMARAAERTADPGEAFEALLRGYLEAAEGDSAFQLALLGSEQRPWGDIDDQKAEFREIGSRVIERAIAAGAVRDDLTFADFPVLATGLMSTMYFRPSLTSDWRRHLALQLDGVRARKPADGAR
ncbi:putative TetR family transcriptional regulator [Actinacidiphila reveromycinica]|uniref:Putative TetR family transcriptional regulator n=1 Tax=Actinacidiphila reveromycinica TaxID=659352 RepID=A0A7U3UNA8_9ACTN|nr:TetR/AcrR family transcriptional regulator [Streptomyces sp. SN-593]BBA95723.1 putative TetR family transcriptional regulator [Streptomyces sp. SN-593]